MKVIEEIIEQRKIIQDLKSAFTEEIKELSDNALRSIESQENQSADSLSEEKTEEEIKEDTTKRLNDTIQTLEAEIRTTNKEIDQYNQNKKILTTAGKALNRVTPENGVNVTEQIKSTEDTLNSDKTKLHASQSALKKIEESKKEFEDAYKVAEKEFNNNLKNPNNKLKTLENELKALEQEEAKIVKVEQEKFLQDIIQDATL